MSVPLACLGDVPVQWHSEAFELLFILFGLMGMFGAFSVAA